MFKLLKISFLSLLCSTCLEAAVLHDNLADFDGRVNEYFYSRPAMFGESTRKVFIKRQKINVPGVQSNVSDVRASFISGTGTNIFKSERSLEASARTALNSVSFESVSGREGRTSPIRFVPDKSESIMSGINFDTATRFANFSEAIYFKLPKAAKAYADMGFTEQRYIVALQSETEAAVLKNKDIIVVAARGTEPTSLVNWMYNAKFFQVPVLQGASPQAHLGFAQAAADIYPLVRSEIVSTFENKIRSIIKKIAQEPGGAAKLASYGINGKVQSPDHRPIYLTGHSLGGAIATLIYGELTLNWLDTSNMGYYFNDPVLAKVSDEKINELIKDTIEEESLLDAEVPRTFSFYEEDVFSSVGQLTHLAVIQNESSFSATPVKDVEGVTIDRRLKGLRTFGAPRSMDWLFKYAAEKYAASSGSQILRFENYLRAENGRFSNLVADIVPRVPLSQVGSGYLFPEYTHVGFSVSFQMKKDDLPSNPAFVSCIYTNKARERNLTFNLVDNIDFISFHNMRLYMQRAEGFAQNASSFPTDHSCKTLRYQDREI